MTLAAVPGAVVSKPTPRNTTSRSGCFFASSTASMGEYTSSTEPPLARLCARSSPRFEPGTRIMSP